MRSKIGRKHKQAGILIQVQRSAGIITLTNILAQQEKPANSFDTGHYHIYSTHASAQKQLVFKLPLLSLEIIMSFLCIACFDPLGMESRKITDGQITASTEFNSAHGATNARLNFKAGGGKTGAWSALRNDVHQWLQVDLGAKTEVTGIQIQGRQDADQWVTSFTISYSSDGNTYTSYQNSKVCKKMKILPRQTQAND